MSNPANQLLSYEFDTIVQASSIYFFLPMGLTPGEIKQNQVDVKNGNRGDEGSKQFILNYTAATEALKPEFGAAKFYVKMT